VRLIALELVAGSAEGGGEKGGEREKASRGELRDVGSYQFFEGEKERGE